MANWCGLCQYEDYDGAEEPCINCVKNFEEIPTEFFPKRPNKPTTNYDSIVSKTPEELAKFMGELPCCPPGADVTELCYPIDSCEGTDLQVQCWLDWLKQEAHL